ncbi:MAG TPA: hypothetical protein VKE69_03800 [Planctomycetota bacterium]|nr:hypothetical protein [Planctomycetota bacterium]
MRGFLALLQLEWRRRLPLLAGATAFAAASWTVALIAFPALGRGTASAETRLLATSLFAAFAASVAFASDGANGRLEFLFANGARPLPLFAARAFVAIAATAGFGAALDVIEAGRAAIAPTPPIPAELPTTPGFLEAVVLYLCPALALFLFLSAISSRGATALAAGALMLVAVVALDRLAALQGEAARRRELASTLSTAALVPAALGLAAVALLVRRVEPERSRPRVLLLGAVVAVLVVRVGSIAVAGGTELTGEPLPTALAVSPDGRRVAIETARFWNPGKNTAWISGALGRPVSRKPEPFGERVVVAAIDGTASLASPLPCRISTVPDLPAWVSPRLLRIRGLDPREVAEDPGAPTSLLYDAERRRLVDAPTLTRVDAERAARELRWTVSLPAAGEPLSATPWSGAPPIRDEDGDGRLEIPLANGRSLALADTGVLELVEGGVRSRLWPATAH